jgi:hypothetical protein
MRWASRSTPWPASLNRSSMRRSRLTRIWPTSRSCRLEAPVVSPADFTHTAELIARGYKSTRKFLGSLSHGPAPARPLPSAIRAA